MYVCSSLYFCISCDDVDKYAFIIENCDVDEQKMDDDVQYVLDNRFTSMISNNNVCGIIDTYCIYTNNYINK